MSGSGMRHSSCESRASRGWRAQRSSCGCREPLRERSRLLVGYWVSEAERCSLYIFLILYAHKRCYLVNVSHIIRPPVNPPSRLRLCRHSARYDRTEDFLKGILRAKYLDLICYTTRDSGIAQSRDGTRSGVHRIVCCFISQYCIPDRDERLRILLPSSVFKRAPHILHAS